MRCIWIYTWHLVQDVCCITVSMALLMWNNKTRWQRLLAVYCFPLFPSSYRYYSSIGTAAQRVWTGTHRGMGGLVAFFHVRMTRVKISFWTVLAVLNRFNLNVNQIKWTQNCCVLFRIFFFNFHHVNTFRRQSFFGENDGNYYKQQIKCVENKMILLFPIHQHYSNAVLLRMWNPRVINYILKKASSIRQMHIKSTTSIVECLYVFVCWNKDSSCSRVFSFSEQKERKKQIHRR